MYPLNPGQQSHKNKKKIHKRQKNSYVASGIKNIGKRHWLKKSLIQKTLINILLRQHIFLLYINKELLLLG